MLNAAAYLASLHDGRAVYLDGRQVDDVTIEHVLQPSIRWLSQIYDKFYRPGDSASGPYFFIPRTVDDLRALAIQQREWDISTIITSEALLMILTAASRMRDDYPTYAERASQYFSETCRRDVRMAFAITDAKGDRSRAPQDQDDPDLYLRIVERQADGVVIRGAKLHVSNCAIVHEIIVMPTKRMRAGEEQWAFAGAVPVSSPGVRVVCVSHAPPRADPERFPLSSRYAISEAMVVFDDVFVPTERVFLAGEVEYSGTWAHALGMWERLGALAHAVETADVLVGLGQLIAEANGLDRVPHIRQKIGDMIMYATLLRAGLDAAISNAEYTSEGYATPSELYTNAAKFYAAAQFSLMVRNLHDISGGGVITAPSLLDLMSPDFGAYVEKYLTTGAGTTSGEDRIRLFHAIRDLTADAYGGWREITLLLGGGGLHAQRLVATKHYDMIAAKVLARSAAGLTEPTLNESAVEGPLPLGAP
jgi:4-hydroxybutyryl-CoA dehydratase / vinylacetyl-CoA-Delta-isomerase